MSVGGGKTEGVVKTIRKEMFGEGLIDRQARERYPDQSQPVHHKPIIDPVQRHRTVQTKVPIRRNSHFTKTVVTREPIQRELALAERSNLFSLVCLGFASRSQKF